MKISGKNLGTKEVTLNRLTSYDWTDDIEELDKIKMIEDMYLSLYQENTSVNMMNLDANGKVIIEKGMSNHRCSNEMEGLRNISKYGVLATEWFGELESEREGCFCTFISKIKGDNYLGGKGDLAEDDYSRLNIGKDVLLFLDDSNEIMQKLLHLDFFEYEHIKEDNPNKISEMYSLEEIKILEFIEKLSLSGKDMRTPFDFKTNYWSAIPGGIPSFLVNGVCIKKNNYSEEELDEINNLFPNAIIFNNERSVIKAPININQQSINNKHSLK